MAAFSLTIFTGAFLLFLVQPLIGRYILPWFGGGPGVWTACMLFFQLTLLAGYGYAHYSRERFSLRRQALVHGALLVIALLFLPITPSAAWRPSAQNNPTVYILILLAANIGVPFLVLSSTGPLLQHWFSQLYPGTAPYRLYALSNVGSLLALLIFPFVLEPRFTRGSQASMWGAGLVIYVFCCGWCALKVWRAPRAGPAVTNAATVDDRDEDTTTTSQRLLWFLLPACASVLLLATTNKLCQDVAVVPFLWVLPLAIYLLSFIIAFDSPRWYVRSIFALALIAALSLMCWALFHLAGASLFKQVATYSASAFCVLHGLSWRSSIGFVRRPATSPPFTWSSPSVGPLAVCSLAWRRPCSSRILLNCTGACSFAACCSWSCVFGKSNLMPRVRAPHSSPGIIGEPWLAPFRLSRSSPWIG